MSYNHYRNAAPGWGTNQFQFGPPPTPNFQPQPTWGGMDYYRAHAASPDPSLYNHAWDRVRNYTGEADGGVGKHEARHWHRRAYGGLGQLNQMLPSEIGHAAAYEAYRTWVHNSSIYEPLSGDMARQREGLIGLSIAEATRMLQYSGRTLDRFNRVEACEAAAATASIIFNQIRDEDYVTGRRGRRGSFSRYSPTMEPFGYDKFGGSPNAVPIPGSNMSAAGSAYGGHGSYGSYGSYGSQAPMGPASMPMPIGQSAAPMYSTPSSYGGGYGGMPPMQANMAGGVPVQPGSVVIVSKPRKHHRHSSSGSHHHHHRHHSHSRRPSFSSIDMLNPQPIGMGGSPMGGMMGGMGVPMAGYAGSYRY